MSFASVPADSFRRRFNRRHWMLVGMLLLVALCVYLIGNNLFPLLDRDEPRFAQASKQMVESGDWTTPHFLDEPRLNKPILIYWLQASAMKVIGTTDFAARLPSSLAAVATLAVFAIGWPTMIGRRRTWWALFIFATALLPAYIAKVCMADAVQHLFIATAMLCLYRLWRGANGWLTFVILGTACGLAILTKGPPVVMYLATTSVAVWLIGKTLDTPTVTLPIAKTSDRARWVVGLVIVVLLALLVCIPWAIAVERARPGTLETMFSKEVVDRGTSAKEGHTGPPGFYLVSFWVTWFPWCLFWPAAMVQGWKRRHLPWVRFSLAAVIGPWIFLEIYKTKLPHYWLPSYPFMAILTADVVLRGMRARIFDFRENGFRTGTTVWAVAVCLVAAVVVVPPFIGDRSTLAYLVGIVLAIAIAAFGIAVATLLNRRKLQAATLLMGGGMFALLVLVTSVYLPHVPSLTLPFRVAAALRSLDAVAPDQVQMMSYKEPSLAFYQGGTIREQSDNGFLAHAPSARWPQWTVIDDDLWHRAIKSSPTLEAKMRTRGLFAGMNPAAGRRLVNVRILEKVGPPTTMP